MAVVRKSLEDILARDPRVDPSRLNTVTEDDIRRYMVEDGENPDADLSAFQAIYPAQVVRKELGMTQEEFASALHIPVATLRNWEQGRVAPDPAARALLLIVARNPKAALRALAA